MNDYKTTKLSHGLCNVFYKLKLNPYTWFTGNNLNNYWGKVKYGNFK